MRYFDVAPVAMAALDREGLVAAVNRAWATLTGVDPDAQIGRLLTDTMGAFRPNGGDGLLECVTQPGKRYRLDIGGIGDARVASLVEVPAGVSYENAAADEARRARGALMREAEVGFIRFDPDRGVIEFDPDLAPEYAGARLRSVDAAALAQVQHVDDRKRDQALLYRLSREGGTGDIEVRYRVEAGAWRHIAIHYAAGEPLASGLRPVYGLTRGITSLARARDDAKINSHRLRIALKKASAAVFELDHTTGNIWASPELADLLGADGVAEVIDARLLAFHPDDHAAVTHVSGRAREGLPTEPVDVRLAVRGEERWVRLYIEGQPSRNGPPKRSIGLILDIHEQKLQALALDEARDIAERAAAAKSEFLASVSHEIRTPMNGVVGILNLLKRESLSDEGRALLDEALACSHMLGQVINDVLDFSKIEAGKLDITPEPTDLAAVARSVVELLQPQAEAKDLWLRAEIAPDLGWAAVDPVRLRQCLFNLLGNAVKFTIAGGIRLRLEARAAGPARRLYCEVEDTGIGIPEDAGERLFERFEQAEAGSTRRFGGTGLGLSISRQLIRMMGGDLDFESREGHGSRFWFEIEAPEALALVEPAPAAGVEGEPLEGLTILVVDDNATNRMVASKTLEALGAAAHAVDSGEAAIEVLQQGAFDLVLMDVNMPVMDGIEATRRIRALPSPVSRTPILALTANVLTHQRQSYLAAGMDGVVPKPFSPFELLTAIGRLVVEDHVSQAGAA